MGKIKLLSPVAWLSPLHPVPGQGVASGSPAGCTGGRPQGLQPKASGGCCGHESASASAMKAESEPCPGLPPPSHDPPTTTTNSPLLPPLRLGPQIVADDCGSSELHKERLHCQNDFDPKFNLGNSLLFPHSFAFFCLCLIHV